MPKPTPINLDSIELEKAAVVIRLAMMLRSNARNNFERPLERFLQALIFDEKELLRFVDEIERSSMLARMEEEKAARREERAKSRTKAAKKAAG